MYGDNNLTKENAELLSQIMPRWMHVLENVEWLSDLAENQHELEKDMRLSSYECCMVGEINCFQGKYAHDPALVGVEDETMEQLSMLLYEVVMSSKYIEDNNRSNKAGKHTESKQDVLDRLSASFYRLLNILANYLREHQMQLVKQKKKEYADIVKQYQMAVETNPNT